MNVKKEKVVGGGRGRDEHRTLNVQLSTLNEETN